MDEFISGVVGAASGPRRSSKPSPLTIAGGIGGAVGGVAIGQGLAMASPAGPYLAIALPLAVLAVGALLLRRFVGWRLVRAAALGFAIACGALLLLFAGAG